MDQDSTTLPRIDVRVHEIDADVAAVRREYEDMVHERSGGGVYQPADWQRISYVLGLAEDGGRLLDVGVGAGQFVNAAARSNRFGAVVGADRIRYGRYVELSGGITSVRTALVGLPFPDDAFDTVTCMEVLEHVVDADLRPGVAELRRVCRRQLLVTMPYREPEPLSPHHRRRIDDQDLVALFPKARCTVLDRGGRPWVLVEERLDGSSAARPTEAELLRFRVSELERELTQLRRHRAVRALVGAEAMARRLRWALARRRSRRRGRRRSSDHGAA